MFALLSIVAYCAGAAKRPQEGGCLAFLRTHGYGLLAVLLSALLFFPGARSIPFYTKGEPREAVVVWEIYSEGEWILPLRNGTEIPSKPPLFHWLGALASHVAGGVNEFTVRFPSFFLGVAGVALTYWTGASLWGAEVGAIAAVVLATSFEWLRAATTARVDMTLTFFMVAALFLFFFLHRRGHGGRAGGAVLALLLGLATLAKGPVGFLLPCLAITVFLAVRRDLAFARTLHPLCAAAIVMAVAGSWYALAVWAGGQQFVAKQVVRENLLRFFSAEAGHTGHEHPFYYLILTFLAGMAPWSFFFPALAFSLFRRRARLGDSGVVYLLVWFATVFLFYSLASAKRGVYVLPVYPPAALLVGLWWRDLRAGHVAEGDCGARLARLGGFLCVGLFLVYALAVGVEAAGGGLLVWMGGGLPTPDRASVGVVARAIVDHRYLVVPWVALTSAAVLVLLRALLVRRWAGVWACVGLLTVAVIVFAQVVLHPAIAGDRTFKPFMQRVARVVGGGGKLVFYRAFDYGALFYGRRRIPWYGTDPPRIGPEECIYLLMPERGWEAFGQRASGSARVVDRSSGSGPKGRTRLILVAAGSCRE